MWGELDEADDRSFNLKVYGTNNEYTGISVNVVPSMMTIMDLKRQFAEKVTLISIYPSIQHCHCQAIINIDYFRLADPLT